VRSLSVINWAATYATRGVDWLGRYAERTGQRRGQALAELGIEFPPGLEGDTDLINRAIVLDGRSIGAIGLQADSFPGIMYARVLRQGAPAPPELVRGLRLGFEATQIRKLIYDTDLASVARPALEASAVARGRAIFFDRITGDIINQQILVDVPPVYASAGLQPPLLAPIDETRPMSARIPVRCVSCHSATTLATEKPIPRTGLEIPRCTDCHLVHEPVGILAMAGLRKSDGPMGLSSIFDEFDIDRASASAQKVQAVCARCHDRHPALATPIPYTNCAILPFDADGDGRAQNDERDDLAAGGIGTDALFGFEVDRRALADKNVRVTVTRIPSTHRRGPSESVQIAGPWVRTAPLTTLVASAPYLHNGSVPTLEALLEATDARPTTFTLGSGQGAFTFDTCLPGNRNTGHEFGIKLSVEEKRDLVAFLQSL
jgi:cytochrome c553